MNWWFLGVWYGAYHNVVDVRLLGELWIWNFIRFLEVLINDDDDDDGDVDVIELLHATWWWIVVEHVHSESYVHAS